MPKIIPERLIGLIEKRFPDWHAIEQIGNGSYSRTYRVQKRDNTQAALKWIEYPEDKQAISELYARGAGEAVIQEYRKNTCILLDEEIQMLKKLQGNPNIVNLLDSAVEQREDGNYDLLILMELLQPLPTIVPQMTIGDVWQLGQDICEALYACEQAKIMHRDIKPENIFRKSDGTFQLGDFGIARKMNGEQLHSVCGTPLYMAPEVSRELSSYDHRADIYSLGLVMYELLNAQCPPFVEAQNKPVTTQDEETSIRLRLAGNQPLPAPIQAPDSLGKIILHACSYNIEDRYSSAEEMLQELQNLNIRSRQAEKLQGMQNRSVYIQNEQATASQTRRALPRDTITLPLGPQREPQSGKDGTTAEDDDEPTSKGSQERLIPIITGQTNRNPFTLIKKIREHRKKILITAVAVVSLIAVIILGIVLLSNSSKQMTNLHFTQSGTLCNIFWEKGGAAPWQIAVISEENTLIYKASVDKRTFQIHLMPGKNYIIEVGDNSLEVHMQKLLNYNGNVELQTGTLCSYIEQTGDKTSKRVPLSNNSFSYSKNIGSEGQSGYEIRLRYQYYSSANAQPVEALCLIQYGNILTEKTFKLTPTNDSEDAVIYIPLNDVLKQSDNTSGQLCCYLCIQNQLWYEGVFEASRKD